MVEPSRDSTAATTILRTSSARIVPVEMTLRQRILSAIAHPNIAYILLSLGTLGLTIELWSPGAVLPGVVGGLSLLLAFFALQVLPINYAGLMLMLFGLLLLMLELKVTSYGLLTTAASSSLIFGSLMLVDTPVPELQLNVGLVVSVVVGFTAIAAFLVRLAVASQKTAPSYRRGRAGRRVWRSVDADGGRSRRADCASMVKSGTRRRTSRSPAAIAS